MDLKIKLFCHTYMQYTHSLITINFAVFLYNREDFFSFRSAISVNVKFLERLHQLFFCVGHGVCFLLYLAKVNISEMIMIAFQPAGELEYPRPGSLGFVLSLLPALPIHDGHGNLQLFSRQAVRPSQSIVCIAKFTGMVRNITLSSNTQSSPMTSR